MSDHETPQENSGEKLEGSKEYLELQSRLKELARELNNFYCYFPGGYYRTIRSNRMQENIEAIDKLLEEEFSDINPEELMKIFLSSRAEIAIARNISDYEAIEVRVEALEKLVPILNRMIELGFKKEDLIR